MKNLITKFKEKQIKKKIKAFKEGKMEKFFGNSYYLDGAIFAEENGYPGNAIQLYSLYAKKHIDNGVAYLYASNVALRKGAGKRQFI